MPYMSKEAVMSSRIEGTRISLSDFFASKAQEKTSSSGIKNKINEIISTSRRRKRHSARKTEVVFWVKTPTWRLAH